MKNSAAGLMVLALFTASLNLRPAINSISPLIETLRNDLGMSASVASLLTTIPVFCMGVFSPLAVKLGVRMGIEWLLGWSLVLIWIGTGLRLFAGSTFFLLFTTFLTGIGIAAVGPLLTGFIKRHFPKHIPAMISVYTVSLTMGAALASGLSAPIQNEMNSWQAALSIWAILALIAVPIWWLFVLRPFGKQITRTSTHKTETLPWANKKAWLLTISFGLMAMLFYTITAWLPPIIENMGYSKLYASNILTIFAFIQIPGNLVIPMLLKRYPSRLLWLLTFSFIELIGFLMVLLSLQPVISAIFLGIGVSGVFSLNLLLPIDLTTNDKDAATWSGMTQSIGYAIGSMGPLLLGWVHDITGEFVSSVIGLIVINLIMMLVQIAAVPRIQKRQVKAA